jgi:predicted naringenin-chalcone synthase
MGGMTIPHLNRIGTAVPANEIHGAFITFARTLLDTDRNRMVFDRMAERSGITSRYSVLRPGTPGADQVDADGFLNRGRFPSTGARMQRYEQHATDLALAAIGALAEDPARFTHLVLASCTGFTAPGLDQVLAARLGMSPALERTVVGFMGCYAAVTALRNAYHIVRSDPAARVLVVNLELCTLHLQETPDLETVLAFMLFGDGATAALVTAEPHGLALLDFRATTLPGSAGLITWRIGDQGFDMRLSGQVPARIAGALRGELERTDTGGLLRGQSTQQVDLWAGAACWMRWSRACASAATRSTIPAPCSTISATCRRPPSCSSWSACCATTPGRRGSPWPSAPGWAPRRSGSAAHEPGRAQHGGRADGHRLHGCGRLCGVPRRPGAGQHADLRPPPDPGLAGRRRPQPPGRRADLGVRCRLRAW